MLKWSKLFWSIYLIRNLFSFSTEKYWWKKIIDSYLENSWKHVVNSIIVRMLDYPIDLLPLAARVASLTNLAFVILYLVHITPSIFRFAQASLITWKILASVYGNFQTMIYVMTKLFDPVQFVLYWIALFASYLWFQYVKVQTILH